MDNQTLHEGFMVRLQEEWRINFDRHKLQHNLLHGIRSSQISAVIKMLIDCGVLNETNLKELMERQS